MNADAPSSFARRALGLLGARLALVGLATVLVWMLSRGFDPSAAFPPSPMLLSLSLLPVNLISLWLVIRLLRVDGQTLRGLFAPRRGVGLVADIGWALLWIAVLYIPFVATIIGTMWILHGANTFTAFETVFVNSDAASVTSPVWALVLGVVAVITFAPLNAPAEEAVYRGYALSRLSGIWPRSLAIAACSVAFGLQHAFFAPTVDAMIVYVVAFTVWGIGSSLIAQKQKRLMPIAISHFVVNLMTSSPAVIFPALQLAGVI
ncbi:CPBP family intramembrane metalloprotease [Salinibacterium sp. SWN139]|uniref:CPBP family intramembrane glutamic endopeptidase n=1 Tax=Salinibacterium sp. SWN139 TaxID=2792055 RepID=UPI0018CF9057|nr:CPBP family intramembrane glutamic endopeptidase [Salinibacterium sp. SWN139]MBH0052959.1 CPBP family intramembrane metalloprotease [Salinibacterium sp. SWN139]